MEIHLTKEDVEKVLRLYIAESMSVDINRIGEMRFSYDGQYDKKEVDGVRFEISEAKELNAKA